MQCSVSISFNKYGFSYEILRHINCEIFSIQFSAPLGKYRRRSLPFFPSQLRLNAHRVFAEEKMRSKNASFKRTIAIPVSRHISTRILTNNCSLFYVISPE